METLKPILKIEKVNDQVYNVWYLIYDGSGEVWKQKNLGQFCLDVDGDWLLFLTGTGGWKRHVIAELSAAFARFLPTVVGPTEDDLGGYPVYERRRDGI